MLKKPLSGLHMVLIPAGFFVSAFILLQTSAEGRSTNAFGCELKPQAPASAGDTLHFALACQDTVGLSVTWEVPKENLKTASTPGLLVFSHAFASPGRNLVFARFQGELIPASAVQIITYPATPKKPTHSSTIIYDASARRIWNVNSDNHSVTAIDAVAKTRLFERTVGKNPRTLAQAPDGSIWVANQDEATLSILDGTDGSPLKTIPLPYASRPYGVAIDPAGQFAFVTLEASGSLVKIDVQTRSIVATLKVVPTPRGIAISHDGRRVLITRFISPLDRGEVMEVDASTFTVTRTFALAPDNGPDGEANSRGIPNAISSVVISPDGRRAWVPSKKDNVGRGRFVDGLDPSFETTVRTIVSVLDLENNRELFELRADLDNRSLASAVAFTRLGHLGFVAAQAANHIDIRHGDNLEMAAAIEPAGLTEELAPQGLVLDPKDSLLFIQYFMSREVGIYEVGKAGEGAPPPRLALIKTVEQEKLAPHVLRGKQIFYNAADTRMTLDNYISCVVCHMDGGSDRRVWDFTDRGEGLRKTTSLLGRGGMGHGPVHWSANFDEIQDFEHDIRGPFGGSGFMPDALFNAGTVNNTLGDKKAGLSPELDALAAYVASLTRVNLSPHRNPDGSMTAQALAGKEIFHRKDVGCFQCHSGDGFTDSGKPGAGGAAFTLVPGRDTVTAEGFLLHDVGTLTAGSGKRMGGALPGFDTPTLKGIWEMPPYLHDGSAPTLMDVLTTRNPNDKHGKTSHLSQTQKEQLVAFLMQLDEADETGKVFVKREFVADKTPLLRAVLRNGRLTLENAGPGPFHVKVRDVTGRRLFQDSFFQGSFSGSMSGNALKGLPLNTGRLILEVESRSYKKVIPLGVHR